MFCNFLKLRNNKKKKQLDQQIEFLNIEIDSKTIKIYLFSTKLQQACNFVVATIKTKTLLY